MSNKLKLITATIICVALFTLLYWILSTLLFSRLPLEWQNSLYTYGLTLIVAVGVVAGIAQISGFSIKDFFSLDKTAGDRFERQLQKDREQIEKIVKLVPVESEALQFLRQHDFGSPYEDGQTEPFWELKRLLSQPSYFFINNELEKAKIELLQELTDFEQLISTEMFVSERRSKYWELANPNEIIVKRALVYKKHHRKEMSDEEFAQLEKEVWKEHNKTRETLNLMADNICKKYDILMSKAHWIL